VRTCLTKTALGTPSHLAYEPGRGYAWAGDLTEDDWSLGEVGRVRDLTELAHAMGSELAWRPPKAHERAFRELLGENADLTGIRWDLAVPREVFLESVRDVFQRSQELLKNSDEWNYLGTFERTQRAICDLAPVTVDRACLVELLGSAPEGRREDLRSLSGGGQVRYSRMTTTGRLSVVRGPRILTLDRRFRSALRSRHGDDGLIVQLDYVSLEPRVTLGLTGQDAPSDVYSILSGSVSELSRDDLKRATMTVLFGGGLPRLQEVLGGSRDPTAVMDGLRSAFRLRTLEDRLIQEHNVAGLVLNHYGRVMVPRRSDSGYLVATHVQSTAVDVALLGFGRIRQEASQIDGIDAIGIVHDALWLDVHRDVAGYTERLREVGSEVPGFDLRFPLGEKNVHEQG